MELTVFQPLSPGDLLALADGVLARIAGDAELFVRGARRPK